MKFKMLIHYFYFVPDSVSRTRGDSGRWGEIRVARARNNNWISLNIPGKLSSIIGLIWSESLCVRRELKSILSSQNTWSGAFKLFINNYPFLNRMKSQENRYLVVLMRNTKSFQTEFLFYDWMKYRMFIINVDFDGAWGWRGDSSNGNVSFKMPPDH